MGLVAKLGQAKVEPFSCAYLSMYNNINSNPVGFDESSSGGSAIYLVILGKPRVE